MTVRDVTAEGCYGFSRQGLFFCFLFGARPVLSGFSGCGCPDSCFPAVSCFSDRQWFRVRSVFRNAFFIFPFSGVSSQAGLSDGRACTSCSGACPESGQAGVRPAGSTAKSGLSADCSWQRLLSGFMRCLPLFLTVRQAGMALRFLQFVPYCKAGRRYTAGHPELNSFMLFSVYTDR